MRFLWRMVFGGVILLILVPLFRGADSGSDELERNRLLLEKWRKDPERYESLRRELRAFLALPEERQKRLRQLDQDLRDEDSATSVRLQGVLERYAEWLQRLPEADRQRIQHTADPKKRLQLIRELREHEWVQRLPKAIREDLEKLPADQQRVRITQLRQEERKRREQWQVAIRNWAELTQNRPQITRLQELAPDVKAFVNESLFPMLTPEEKNRLLQAEGKHPLFLRTLVELADKHPIKLPGPTTGPATFEQTAPPAADAPGKTAGLAFSPSEANGGEMARLRHMGYAICQRAQGALAQAARAVPSGRVFAQCSRVYREKARPRSRCR